MAGARVAMGAMAGLLCLVAASVACTSVTARAPAASRPALVTRVALTAATELEITDVPAETEGLHCRVYLTRPTGARDVDVAYAQNGTGIYTVANDTPQFFRGELDGSRRLALLMIDKPGITATASGEPEVGKDFRRYVVGDLVECARHALTWALARPFVSTGARVVMSGHSEGALVISEAYARGMRAHDAWVSRTQVLALASAPFEQLFTLLERQIRDEGPEEPARFARALAGRDDDYFARLGGVSTRWIDDARTLPALGETLEEIGRSETPPRIEVFGGERDRQTPLDHARRFAESHRGLRFELHTYDAGHSLNPEATKDIRDALLSKL